MDKVNFIFLLMAVVHFLSSVLLCDLARTAAVAEN